MSLRTLLLAVVSSPAMRMTLSSSKLSLPLSSLPVGRRRTRSLPRRGVLGPEVREAHQRTVTYLSPAHTCPQAQHRPLAVPLSAHDVVWIALIGDRAPPQTYVAANGVGLSGADGAGGKKWSAPPTKSARRSTISAPHLSHLKQRQREGARHDVCLNPPQRAHLDPARAVVAELPWTCRSEKTGSATRAEFSSFFSFIYFLFS